MQIASSFLPAKTNTSNRKDDNVLKFFLMILTKEQVNYLGACAKNFAHAHSLYTLITDRLTITPYMYGEEIDDYVGWAYVNNLVPGDYATIETEYDKNCSNEAWYKTLQEEDVIKCLALAIRRDRFA